MELEEWKMMVLQAHPAATFTVADDGHATARDGEGLNAELVGVYTANGQVWFAGRKQAAVDHV